MVEFLAWHKQASSLKRLIFDDNSDFILQLLNSCNSSLPAIFLQYGLRPLKSVRLR
jgi:hypothetical protein